MYVRAVGGEVGATSALAPKLGPLKLVRAAHRAGEGEGKWKRGKEVVLGRGRVESVGLLAAMLGEQ